MKAIADMTYWEIVSVIFEISGVQVGRDATGMCWTAWKNDTRIAGPNASKKLTIYHALRNLVKPS